MPHSKDRETIGRADACKFCAARKPGTAEVYEFRDGLDVYWFNTARAKEIVADGRSAIKVPDDIIQAILRVNHIDEDHLKHVNPENPGILAKRYERWILLDGMHRAALRLGAKQDFYSYRLSYEESLTCIVRQEISTTDPEAIVRRLRKVLTNVASTAEPMDIELECESGVLEEVRRLLTPKDNRLLNLRRVGNIKR
jgi:hypothetical protein